MASPTQALVIEAVDDVLKLSVARSGEASLTRGMYCILQIVS